jgi:hypothetical protein
MGINWDVTKEDAELINKIARRGLKMIEDQGVDHYRLKDLFLSCVMDVTAVHVNRNPLRLQEFLDADNFNFAHDFFGIIDHVDRSTGKLGRFFLPRFSQPKIDTGSNTVDFFPAQ